MVVVQNDIGCIHSETITVVPLTSQLKRPELPAHYILEEADFLKKKSMALAEAIGTIDKRQVRFYLGKLSDKDMNGVDAAITSHLGYEIAWCIEEAAAYSGIGRHKLRELTDNENCSFVLWVGSKRLIKRRLLDQFLDNMYSI